MQTIEAALAEIPYIDTLLEIKGIGITTVCGFVAEVGDIGRFDNPKQLQKLAGYAIVSNDSGKHNGESQISYRGRKRLRYVLYEAAISVIGKNAEFRQIHHYYRSREKNPLKKMQSVVAVACKLIRIFCRNMYGVTHVCVTTDDIKEIDKLEDGLYPVSLVEDGDSYVLLRKNGDLLGHLGIDFVNLIKSLKSQNQIASTPQVIKGISLKVVDGNVEILGMGHMKFIEY